MIEDNVSDNINGGSYGGNGMSRAALKKKKNKRKQQQLQQQPQQQQQHAPSAKSTTKTSDASAAFISAETVTVIDHTTNKKKRKNLLTLSSKFGVINDDDLAFPDEDNNRNDVQDGDKNDDDDEQVPMKQPAKDGATESSSSSSSSSLLLPNECRTLHEILLVSSSDQHASNKDNDDDDDETEEDIKTTPNTVVVNQQKTMTILQQMTIEQRAQCALEFLLQPSYISKETFYTKYYEQLPLHVSSSSSSSQQQQKRHQQRYEKIFSISDLRSMIQNNTLVYGTDLNVTRYEPSTEDGIYRRITLDKKKRNRTNEYEEVNNEEVWDLYENHKCTIRLLCPQQYNDTIYTLLSLLEHEFHCMVGSNIYCTPPNAAQGFAPHYDDIDAYIVQLEGCKRWKVYAPIHKQERLPRTSSHDYTTTDLMSIEPMLDVVLHPGDMLYMPRGWIHQACTIPSKNNNNNTSSTIDDDDTPQQHSLHLTISTMQQWAWADYLEILVPEALQATIQSATTTVLREGLPNGFLSYMGAMYDNRTELLPDILQSKLNPPNNDVSTAPNDKNDDDDDDDCVAVQQQQLLQQQRQALQEEFRTQTKRRLMRVVKEAMTMIDAACDQIGKRFLSERLPPALTMSERQLTCESTATTMPQPQHKLTPDVMCQIVRPGIARLVLEDGMAIVYHCNDNSRVYHETPISPIEFEMDDAPAIEQLLTTIPPYYITIQDLIHDTIDDKVGIAQALFDEGILAIRR